MWYYEKGVITHEKKTTIFLVIAVILILLISIILYRNITKEEKNENENFKIVTTFYPIYIMAANITQGAENVELTNMTDTNIGCLHDYTLTTSDMKKLENADIIIQNGLGLENFMDKILNTYSNIKIIDSSKNIANTIEEDGQVNSHIWTSLNNYIIQVEEITKGLSEVNPENASIYTENKENYISKLQEIKEKYDTELANIKGKKAICLNEALTYIAEEVGLEITSVKTDHEESSLSAEMIKSLIDKMNLEGIKIILVDSEDDLRNAQTLASETGAEIYKLNSGLTGSMDKNAYINIMNENLEQFKKMQ